MPVLKQGMRKVGFRMHKEIVEVITPVQTGTAGRAPEKRARAHPGAPWPLWGPAPHPGRLPCLLGASKRDLSALSAAACGDGPSLWMALFRDLGSSLLLHPFFLTGIGRRLKQNKTTERALKSLERKKGQWNVM